MSNELETSTNAQSDEDRFNGGGVSPTIPRLLLSAAVSGGRGSYDITDRSPSLVSALLKAIPISTTSMGVSVQPIFRLEVGT
jgi:hypothetical protein